MTKLHLVWVMIASIQPGATNAEDPKTAAAPSSQLFADAIGEILQVGCTVSNTPTVDTVSTETGKSELPAKSKKTSPEPEIEQEPVPATFVPVTVPTTTAVVNTYMSATEGMVPANSPAPLSQVPDVLTVTSTSTSIGADDPVTELNIKEPIQAPVIKSAEGLIDNSAAELPSPQHKAELHPDAASANSQRSAVPDLPEPLPTVAPQQTNGEGDVPIISSRKASEPIVASASSASIVKPESSPAPKAAPKASREMAPRSGPARSDEDKPSQAQPDIVRPSAAKALLSDEVSKTVVQDPLAKSVPKSPPEMPECAVPADHSFGRPKDAETPPPADANPSPDKPLKSTDVQLLPAQSQQPTSHFEAPNVRVEAVQTIQPNHYSSDSGTTSPKPSALVSHEAAQLPRPEIQASQFNDVRPEPGAMHLVSKLERQEMRFGWTSQDFGRIEIRTSLVQDRVGAVVSVPDAHLRASLQAEIGSLHVALAGHSLELSQFSAFDSSASGNPNRDQDLQSQTNDRAWNLKEDSEPSSLVSRNLNRTHAGLIDLRA